MNINNFRFYIICFIIFISPFNISIPNIAYSDFEYIAVYILILSYLFEPNKLLNIVFRNKSFRYDVQLLLILVLLVTISSYRNHVDGTLYGYSDLRQLYFMTLCFIVFIEVLSIQFININVIFRVYLLSTLTLSLFFLFGIGIEVIDGRLYLLGNNPNSMANRFTTTLIIITHFIIFKNKKLINKWIAILYLMPVCIFMLGLTGSRGGLINLFLSVVLYVLLFRTKLTKKLAIISVSGIVIIGLLYFIIGTFHVGTRFIDIQDDQFGNRLPIWEAAIEIGLENPFFGSGVTRFSEQMELVYGRFRPTHNEFISIFVWSGITGLLLFVLFINRIVRKSYNILKNDHNAFYIVLVLIQVSNLLRSGSALFGFMMWIIFAIVLVQTKRKQK